MLKCIWNINLPPPKQTIKIIHPSNSEKVQLKLPIPKQLRSSLDMAILIHQVNIQITLMMIIVLNKLRKYQISILIFEQLLTMGLLKIIKALMKILVTLTIKKNYLANLRIA